MEQQTRGTIGQQIELPFMESVRISFQSLMIRFGRSVITTAGITLGIAFLVSVLVNNEVTMAMKESGSKQEITTFEEEESTGITMKDKWLIIMSLIVCVVGIANSMLMAVTERFQEIGTMKCLGALDRFVVRLFLLESGFQGLRVLSSEHSLVALDRFFWGSRITVWICSFIFPCYRCWMSSLLGSGCY